MFIQILQAKNYFTKAMIMTDKEKVALEKDKQFASKVHEKYSPDKNFLRHARITAERVKSISWGFNTISWLAAIYGIVYFTEVYSGAKKIVLIIIGGVLLIGLEIAKRYSIVQTFEGYYNKDERYKINWGFAIPLFLAISIFVSYHGGDKFIKEESSSPTLVYNSKIDSINEQIALAQADIATNQKQTWKGRITRKAKASIALLDERINNLTSQKIDLENKDLATNEGIEQKHEDKLANFGVIFGSVAGAMDILLILFIGFWAERLEYEVECLIKSSDLTKVKPERIINLASSIQSDARKVQTDFSYSGAHNERNQIGFKKTHTDTHNPVSRVARDTQPATHTDTQSRVSNTQATHINKNADYYVKMIKRVRDRYARSHKEHPRAPKSGSTRKDLYDNAMLEWGELESVGYSIKVDPNNNFRLIIESPNNIKYVES